MKDIPEASCNRGLSLANRVVLPGPTPEMSPKYNPFDIYNVRDRLPMKLPALLVAIVEHEHQCMLTTAGNVGKVCSVNTEARQSFLAALTQIGLVYPVRVGIRHFAQ